jgi:hypothetical protein
MFFREACPENEMQGSNIVAAYNKLETSCVRDLQLHTYIYSPLRIVRLATCSFSLCALTPPFLLSLAWHHCPVKAQMSPVSDYSHFFFEIRSTSCFRCSGPISRKHGSRKALIYCPYSCNIADVVSENFTLTHTLEVLFILRQS